MHHTAQSTEPCSEKRKKNQKLRIQALYRERDDHQPANQHLFKHQTIQVRHKQAHTPTHIHTHTVESKKALQKNPQLQTTGAGE